MEEFVFYLIGAILFILVLGVTLPIIGLIMIGIFKDLKQAYMARG